MACSKYQYVKKFQETQTALLQTYILVRIDGRAFTKFCSSHSFEKPNDLRAIKLMNTAAEHVCSSFTQIFLAYGQSDQYSFVFNKNTTLFSRRTDKILSCVVSAFTAAYIFNWNKFFNIQLIQPPSFDSRIVIYPNESVVKDYFRWRQVDCHINNLYNTTFWCLVKKGMGNQEVQKMLKDTNSAGKNEILFNDFGINYNKVDEIYRRGTFLFYILQKIELQKESQLQLKQKKFQKQLSKQMQSLRIQSQQKEQKVAITKAKVMLKGSGDKIRKKLIWSHEDCIKQQFWINIIK